MYGIGSGQEYLQEGASHQQENSVYHHIILKKCSYFAKIEKKALFHL